MRFSVTAAALTAAFVLAPLPAQAQDTTTETEATATQTTPESQDFTVITEPDQLEGAETAEVRITSIDEAPRDQVSAINSSLDPSNPMAVELRERLTESEHVRQALEEEDVEEERLVGAAMENGALVVYIVPEE